MGNGMQEGISGITEQVKKDSEILVVSGPRSPSDRWVSPSDADAASRYPPRINTGISRTRRET